MNLSEFSQTFQEHVGDLAQIARAQASINELKLRKLQRIQDFRKEVETHMSEVQRGRQSVGPPNCIDGGV